MGSPMVAESTYSYRARDRSGREVIGSLVAPTAQEAGARLRADGKTVIAIDNRPLTAGTKLNSEQIRRNESAKRVRRDDVISFAQQISVMLETGVPLTEALDAFKNRTKSREFKAVLDAIYNDICSGEQLSTAMARWPRVFPNVMLSLVKASEASGTMSMMLGRVGDYLGKERRTMKQIKGAVSYPAFMMLAGVVLTVFLMTFVLPKFARIYESRSATLPTPTKVLLGISQFFTGQYLYYGPALLVFGVFMAIWLRTTSGKGAMDWLRLNVPILRGMYSQLYITRSARTMSTLLAAGVNLLDIISICRGVTNNAQFDALWEDMETGIREGRQMSEAIFECRYVPPNVASMIASGERSGRLSQVMERIAEFSEQELDDSVKQSTAFIEPIMIICMGLMIGAVAMALLLPIFSMGNVVAGG